jgi:hypothetical protein
VENDNWKSPTLSKLHIMMRFRFEVIQYQAKEGYSPFSMVRLVFRTIQIVDKIDPMHPDKKIRSNLAIEIQGYRAGPFFFNLPKKRFDLPVLGGGANRIKREGEREREWVRNVFSIEQLIPQQYPCRLDLDCTLDMVNRV